MNLQETVEAIPGKVVESIKSFFPSADSKTAEAQKVASETAERLATAEKDRDGARASLTQTNADLATARQTISTLQADLKARDEKIATLEASQKTADQLAAEKAQQICAAQGVPPSALANATKGDAQAQKGRKISRTAFASLNPREQADFCKAGGAVTD